MTTYNTYQEAKIANPGKEIIRFDKQDEFKAVGNDELSAYLTTWTKCNPSDYCMTVEKFLKDNCKFDDGDTYLDWKGRVRIVGKVGFSKDACNDIRNIVNADQAFILRAAALEKIPTETPEEKEVLDGIESAGEAEWKNGDECAFGDRTGIFIGLSKNNRLAIVEIDNEAMDHDIDLVRVRDLSKPETPQQREDRERLEAIDAMCWSVHSLKVSQASALYEAGYRKEKTHDTN